jgi:hypothetical protein
VELIGILIPIIVASFTTYAYDGLKRFVGLLDNAPAVVHQVIVAASGYGLAKLALMLGLSLVGTDITNMVPEDVQMILGATLTYIFKSHKSQKEIKEGRVQ